MEFWTVALICLAAGLVLVIGGALVLYMGSLVKSAYQLKIEIKAEVDDGQRRIEEEIDKKIRWIKRELVEEIDKVKEAIQSDNQRRIAETLDAFTRRLAECEQVVQHHHDEAAQLFEALRHDVNVLGQRQRALRREQKAQAAAVTPPAAEPAAVAPEAAAAESEPAAEALPVELPPADAPAVEATPATEA